MRADETSVDVRIDIRNKGDRLAAPISVRGELWSQAIAGSVDVGAAPGEQASLTLTIPLEHATAGVHALLLAIEYWVSPAPGAAAQVFEQPAYVLVAVGENAPPAVKLSVDDASMDSLGRLRVALESLDHAAHRVTLRVRTPRGIRASPADSEADVPATGRSVVEVPLFRVDVPWLSRQGILVAATTEGEDLARTAAATGVVEVGRDPAVMPRIRTPLVVLAGLLLVGAFVAELQRRRRPAAE